MTESAQLIMSWRTALLGSVMLPLLLCALALILRNSERRSSNWFALLIGSAVLSAIPFFIGFAGAYDIWPGLTFLPVQLTLFFGPLFYLHAHTLMVGGPLRWRWWLLLPGALDWLYQCWAFLFIGDYRAKWAFTDAVHDPYVAPITTFLSIALIIGAAVAIVRLYTHYQRRLPEMLADEERFQPIWLRHFLILGAATGIAWIVATVLGLMDSYDYLGRFWAAFLSLLLLLMLALETYSRVQLNFPKLYDELARLESPVDDQNIDKDWHAVGQSLVAKMKTHQWYLETGLSLTQLAQRAGLNRAYASRALNDGLNVSFSHCVNELRIEYAKSLLLRPEKKIIDIATASGFGSKASFNRVFRQLVNVTPSDFRAKHVSSDQ